MSGSFFDTNIIIYLFEDVDVRKREIATRLVDEALDRDSGTISFQVVQEALNVLCSRVAAPASPERARFLLDTVLVPMWRVMPSQRLYEQALRIRERYRFSFYDSLIVAAAAESGCTHIYSEDLQSGQRIDSLTIENPFIVTS